jgi:propane monooxygenase reductase subunit
MAHRPLLIADCLIGVATPVDSRQFLNHQSTIKSAISNQQSAIGTMLLRVRSVSLATPTSRVVRLNLGRRRFRYRAGQAVLLGLPGQDQRRPYSIASAPEEARAQGYLEFLIKTDAEGRFGPHLAGLRRGARVEVEGPLGSFVFPDAPREDRILFVAGGAGVAPLRTMLHHALARRYQGHVTVLYSARSPRHFAYEAELRHLARRKRIELILTVTREAGADWAGRRGRIDEAALAPLVSTPATLCFVCGPPGLVAGVPPILGRLGVLPRRIRTEKWKT